MEAVIEKPRKAAAGRVRAIEPVSVVQARPAPGGHASGIHLVQDFEHLAWPYADKGDVLEIDFDVRDYKGEGFYLLQHQAPADEVTGPPGRFAERRAQLAAPPSPLASQAEQKKKAKR